MNTHSIAYLNNQKVCHCCNSQLPITQFSSNKARADGLQTQCKECHKKAQKRYSSSEKGRLSQNKRAKKWRKDNKEKALLGDAKRRAKKKNVFFDMKERDIIIPKCCPLLGLEINLEGRDGNIDASPSIDRKDSNKGYTKDNIWVISYKANSMKYTANFEEFEIMYSNWKKIKGG